MKTALIAGSTGLIGKSLLNQLLDCKNYHKVISIVRRPTAIKHPKLEEIILDFNDLTTLLTSEPVNDVFCCLGTTIKKAGSKEAFTKVDYTYVTELAKWAKKSNCQLFSVVSSVGASAKTSNFYLQTKGKMEAKIATLNISTVHIFRPSLLLGDRSEFRLGEKFSEAFMLFFKPLLIGKLRKYRAIKAQEVALAMCKKSQNDLGDLSIFEGSQIC